MLRFFSLVFLASALCGETLSGTILIQRKLTKHSVTPPVSLYQRGSTVQLRSDTAQNPIDFERSHVVVWIEGEGPNQPAEASIEQIGRRFVPDLVVVPVGSSVAFPNSDPIFHNVFSLSKTKSFDLGNYPKGESRYVRFPKTGIVYVGCHLHPNMMAAIAVTPSKRFARADAAGKFEIPDLPPGRYSVVAWHRNAGSFRQFVQVLPGSGGQINFFIPIAEGAE